MLLFLRSSQLPLWSLASWSSLTRRTLVPQKAWSLCASAWPSWASEWPWDWTPAIPSTQPETSARGSSRLWPAGAWMCSGNLQWWRSDKKDPDIIFKVQCFKCATYICNIQSYVGIIIRKKNRRNFFSKLLHSEGHWSIKYCCSYSHQFLRHCRCVM